MGTTTSGSRCYYSETRDLVIKVQLDLWISDVWIFTRLSLECNYKLNSTLSKII